MSIVSGINWDSKLPDQYAFGFSIADKFSYFSPASIEFSTFFWFSVKEEGRDGFLFS